MTDATYSMTSTKVEALALGERHTVLFDKQNLDLPALAAAAGLTVTELEALPQLSSKRGTFRTPYPLLAAVCGYGHGGQPATTMGEVLRRLGFTVNARTGLMDKGNYHRARAAGDFFGIDLPQRSKDGPAPGHSVRHDVHRFTAAWNGASTLVELTAALGQKPSGDTNARNIARGAELGLPDKFSKQARWERRLARYPVDVACAITTPADDVPTKEQAQRAAATQQRAKRCEEGCRHCGGALELTSPGGRRTWGDYCSDRCRFAFHEAARKERNRVEKASAQKPCAHCGTHIEPGARAKEFCSKSCNKKARYRARKAA